MVRAIGRYSALCDARRLAGEGIAAEDRVGSGYGRSGRVDRGKRVTTDLGRLASIFIDEVQSVMTLYKGSIVPFCGTDCINLDSLDNRA
ncbi:hypothetical protein AERO9A_420096 [Aeromonas salmonicida]|nr:hypothetical protein AERO9A_420096 [Aeromonas salmonicida]